MFSEDRESVHWERMGWLTSGEDSSIFIVDFINLFPYLMKRQTNCF